MPSAVADGGMQGSGASVSGWEGEGCGQSLCANCCVVSSKTACHGQFGMQPLQCNFLNAKVAIIRAQYRNMLSFQNTSDKADTLPMQTGLLPDSWGKSLANASNTDLDVHGDAMMLEGPIPQSWGGGGI